MKKKIVIIILAILIVVQFIQPSHNNGAAETATDITHVVQVPDSVMRLLKTSCYDCHSNHTNYPWYSKITPVNWWLNHHIKEGKRELNFSAIAAGNFKRKARKLKETAELVEKHEMPIDSYLWIHSEAKLDEVQRKMIADWAKLAQQQVMQDSLQSIR
jgi:hypothetical protein